MQQINIVISGFTPYDGIDVNPAVLVPVALAEYWNDPSQSVALSDDLLQDVSISVTTVTLPVSFANAWPRPAIRPPRAAARCISRAAREQVRPTP